MRYDGARVLGGAFAARHGEKKIGFGSTRARQVAFRSRDHILGSSWLDQPCTGIMESSGPPSDVHTADASNPDFFGAAHDQESKGKRALEVLTPHHCFISALPHLTQRVGKAALHGSRYHRPRRDSSNTSTPSFEILKSFPVGASGDDDARCEGNVKCRVYYVFLF